MPPRDLILKVALVWRILEGWAAADTIAGRVRAPLADVVEARAWLSEHGYLQHSTHELAMLYRWEPTREFEEAWRQLIPERPCTISFCGKVKPRGRIRERGSQRPVT